MFKRFERIGVTRRTAQRAPVPIGKCQHSIFRVANDVFCKRQRFNELDNVSELRTAKDQYKMGRCSTIMLQGRDSHGVYAEHS